MKIFRNCVFIFALICSPNVFADDLKVAVGLALPPYVFPETDSGMELDIAREALAIVGHTIDPIYVPLARVPRHLQSGMVDAALTVSDALDLNNVFFSNSHITYQNVAITLKKNKLKIDDLNDLSGKTVLAFQNAKLFLGEAFAEVTKKGLSYNEFSDQEKQVVMLYKGRTQVIVLDINIFKYYRQRLKNDYLSEPVVIHRIFPKTHYKMGFIDAKIRDQFNQGLEALHKSGKYDVIISQYVQE